MTADLQHTCTNSHYYTPTLTVSHKYFFFVCETTQLTPEANCCCLKARYKVLLSSAASDAENRLLEIQTINMQLPSYTAHVHLVQSYFTRRRIRHTTTSAMPKANSNIGLFVLNTNCFQPEIVVHSFYSAEHCTSYSKSVRLSVCHTLALCQNDSCYNHMRSSLEDSLMTLVSSRLTSARNAKGNIGSEGAE